MSYAIYRGAGIPACRTAFASVYLTVEGKFENEYLGNYTIVEQVDKQFLAHRFGGNAPVPLTAETTGTTGDASLPLRPSSRAP